MPDHYDEKKKDFPTIWSALRQIIEQKKKNAKVRDADKKKEDK